MQGSSSSSTRSHTNQSGAEAVPDEHFLQQWARSYMYLIPVKTNKRNRICYGLLDAVRDSAEQSAGSSSHLTVQSPRPAWKCSGCSGTVWI